MNKKGKPRNLPMSVWTHIAKCGLLALAALLAGCAGESSLEEGSDVRSAYGSGRFSPTLHIQQVKSPIAREKVVPVITAPEVFALYVPGHVDLDRDMYVGEHWLFVKMRESNWNLPNGNSAEISKKLVTSKEAASISNMRLAVSRIEGIGRIAVPHEKREYINGKEK
jgi:hypothetical protein